MLILHKYVIFEKVRETSRVAGTEVPKMDGNEENNL